MTDTRGATTTPERGRAAKKPFPARVSLFYRQVLAELRKVIWPTRKELITYTTVVYVTSSLRVGQMTLRSSAMTWR